MKICNLITLIVLSITSTLALGQKVQPFQYIAKEILFADTLVIKNNAEQNISQLSQIISSSHSNTYETTKAYYNLAICYASRKDTQNTCLYLQKSLNQSSGFHNLILTDSDFKFLYPTSYWKAVVKTIDSIYPTLFPSIKEKNLAVELYHIFLKDQQSRGLGIKRKDAMFNYDEENLERVKKIIEKYGWPTFSMVGKTAANGAFLVIQHADPQTQQKYYPLLAAAVSKNEADKESYALLTDRLSVHTKGFQIYGTQVFRKRDKVTGRLSEYRYFPIKDEKEVDIRRKEMGLVPIKQYFRFYGIDYVLPK